MTNGHTESYIVNVKPSTLADRGEPIKRLIIGGVFDKTHKTHVIIRSGVDRTQSHASQCVCVCVVEEPI